MRIVIKVGTNILTGKNGSLDRALIGRLAAEIAALKITGAQVVLVSSGAIGAGMGKMGIAARPTDLRQKQALAAIGQPLLMEVYESVFSAVDVTVAQVLLTRQDFDDRQRYINARNTMLTLLDMGVVPVINENDTVAVDEIKIGENDTLSALVAAKISADWLFLFTDVDGLYKGDPGKSELISVVEKVTPEIEAYASDTSASGKGIGGMRTKLVAAKIATAAGVTMVIANGLTAGLVARVVAGQRQGTLFLPQKAINARSCWIAFGASCRGNIVVDAGAAAALVKKGTSLLPAGVSGVEGSFEMGDTVSIHSPTGEEIGRGLVNFSSDDIMKIKGKKTADLKHILPAADYDEVIHRDNLVIL
ncbi:MAG: glutamate 5-kinase [Elusimicrobia bacterium]|nr:glutamate 5-kinase [Elusimicrobiota bacterium]